MLDARTIDTILLEHRHDVDACRKAQGTAALRACKPARKHARVHASLLEYVIS